MYKKANLKSKAYTTDNIYYPDWGMPNCTCYSHGRVKETSGVNPKWAGNPYLNSDKNLSIWNINDGFAKSQTPMVGDVAIWDNGNTGHVAFVEEIHANGDIRISESSYSNPSYMYEERTLKKSNGYKHPFGNLVGFKRTSASTKNNQGGKVLEGWKEYDFVYNKENRIKRKFNGKTYGGSDQIKSKLKYYARPQDVGTGKNYNGKPVYTFPAGELLNLCRYVGHYNGYKVHAVLNDAGTGEVYFAYDEV